MSNHREPAMLGNFLHQHVQQLLLGAAPDTGLRALLQSLRAPSLVHELAIPAQGKTRYQNATLQSIAYCAADGVLTWLHAAPGIKTPLLEDTPTLAPATALFRYTLHTGDKATKTDHSATVFILTENLPTNLALLQV